MKFQIATAIVLVVAAVQVSAQQTPITKLIKYAALGNNEKIKLLLKNNPDIINKKSHYEDIVGIFQFHIFGFNEGNCFVFQYTHCIKSVLDAY